MKIKYSNKPFLTYIIYALVVVIVVFALVGIFYKKDNDGVSTQWRPVQHRDTVENYSYDLDLFLDVDNKQMIGNLDFTYINNNDEAMDTLIFSLFANSFADEAYGAIAQEDFDRAYPNGFSAGSIEIATVAIEGGGHYEITGDQEHLLAVTLDEPVASGDTVELLIEYIVTVPNCLGRFGYGYSTISMVNCNPIMTVYDDGYYSYEYNAIGDPFYSECADYTASITVDEEYTIAVTGDVTGESVYGGFRTTEVVASDMRDFGFVASDRFDIVSQEVNGVTINSYGISSDRLNKKALVAGANAIDAYSRLYGEYPYDTFNVVETDFYIGGMEYPGMVLIDTSYYNLVNESIMEMIIAHEAGHQWWYAQVGNDQVAQPWLDEALTEFSTRVYYEVVYPETADEFISQLFDANSEMLDSYIRRQEMDINHNTMMYEDSLMYSAVVYGRGGLMFEKLRQQMGDEAFFDGMHDYLESNRGEIVDQNDLYQALQEHADFDIPQWFENNFTVQVGR